MDRKYALIADIGATNARFALLDTENGTILESMVLPCLDFSDPAEAAKFYLGHFPDLKIRHGVIAIANPLIADYVEMSNNSWKFSQSAVRTTLNFENLLFINDFAAQALAIKKISAEDKIQVGGQRIDKNFPQLVLGPGSGLGQATLIEEKGRRKFIVIANEAGHRSFAPQNDVEIKILQYARKALNRNRIIAEDFLSGRGLELLHRALHPNLDNFVSAAEITSYALENIESNSAELETVKQFCAIVGSFAADSVLSSGARGGVYLCGGILPKIEKILLASDFRQRFEDLGILSPYISHVAVYLVRDSLSGLLGAAEYVLQEM